MVGARHHRTGPGQARRVLQTDAQYWNFSQQGSTQFISAWRTLRVPGITDETMRLLIALAHDCGHGPAGHASEEAFAPYVPGGYDHAVYGADVIARLIYGRAASTSAPSVAAKYLDTPIDGGTAKDSSGLRSA